MFPTDSPRPGASGSPPPRASRALGFCAGAWVMALAIAFAWMSRYSNTAGVAGTPPAMWPESSGLGTPPSRPTLVMLAHPRCPCTRASVAEFARLMARCGDGVAAHVLFFQPGAAGDDWAETDLWKTAAAIPGVRVHRDLDGTESRRFGVETSGHVLLYGADGTLAFSGGITLSRGHEGDNPGSTAILAALRHSFAPQPAAGPTFGCPLRGTEPESLSAEEPIP